MNLLTKLLSAFSFNKENQQSKLIESRDTGSNQQGHKLINNNNFKTNFMIRRSVITEVVAVETSESIIEFPQNRTLLVEQLTDEPPASAEIVKDIRTMNDVFNHFHPNVKVEFEDTMGQTKKETLSFDELRDFEMEGLMKKSEFLGELALLKDSYAKIEKQLRANNTLRNAISDAESRTALIQSMQALLKELKDSK